MTPNSIKAQMSLRGMTQREVAKRIGCHEVELSQTISGDRINPEIRKNFAVLFGMTAEEMFDSEFEAVVEFRKTA